MADIILSSGYLGFARHIGFLKALEKNKINIDAICGTSSGAIIGSLYASGLSLAEIINIFENQKSSRLVSFNYKFWDGLFSLKKFIHLLEKYLPLTFDDLSIPFGVGVCDKHKNHSLITTGKLVLPVVASGSVPKLFRPIYYQQNYYIDGAVVDRHGLSAWRKLRPDTEIIMHNIASSRSGFKSNFPSNKCLVVNTPRSKSSLFGKTYFKQEVEEAYTIAIKQIESNVSYSLRKSLNN